MPKYLRNRLFEYQTEFDFHYDTDVGLEWLNRSHNYNMEYFIAVFGNTILEALGERA